MDIHDATDYIILKTTAEAGVRLNLLKLQKLLYYVQAWHLAFYDKPLFAGQFQAWIHGPVNRELYDRYSSTKILYSEVAEQDIHPTFDLNRLSQQERIHIDTVLEVYAKCTGSQLEEMTRSEDPWIEARQGYEPNQRCEVYIREETIRNYYTRKKSLARDQPMSDMVEDLSQFIFNLVETLPFPHFISSVCLSRLCPSCREHLLDMRKKPWAILSFFRKHIMKK